jgi:hypothetical protein
MTNKGWYPSLSPKEKEEYNEKRRNKYHCVSNEQKQIRAEKRREQERIYFENLSPEEKEIFCKRRAIRWEKAGKKFEDSLTEEEKKRRYEGVLKKNMSRYNSLSSEEKKQRLKIMREASKKRRQEKRLLVMRHYCKGEPHCMSTTCEVTGGAKHPDSLCIDHINGGGRAHAKEVGGHVIDWIIKNDFPEGLFQVLCQNCNIRKKIANKEDYKRNKDWRTKE